MGVAVIGQRQLQNVLEIAGQHDVAAAVREAVGVKRDQRAAGNGEQPEAGPGGEENAEFLPGRRHAARLRVGQRVDNAAEQNRLGELRGSQRHIGQRQRPGQPAFGAKQGKDAAIKAKKVHATLNMRHKMCAEKSKGINAALV